MLRMEQWSRKWAVQLAEALQYDDDKRDVLNYGLFIMIQTVLSIIATAVIGMICGVFVESIIVSFIIAILRKTSGGGHATSAERCVVLGTLIAVGAALLADRLVAIGTENMIIIMSIMSIVAYIVIGIRVPVDSPSKPIRSIEKRKRLKKKSWYILSIYIVIMVGSLVYGMRSEIQRWGVYSLCILLGIMWQILSLTAVGEWVIQKLDFLLINILKLFQGGKTNEKC